MFLDALSNFQMQLHWETDMSVDADSIESS